MQLANVPGKQSIKDTLVNLYLENKLPHSLLFIEKEGFGALALAIAFAQFVVCEKVKATLNPANDGGSLFDALPIEPLPKPIDSCGRCPACAKAASLIHPDIHFSFPVITKKAGTPPISDDFISEWRSFVADNPYSGVYEWLQFIQAENKQGNITAHECQHINKTLSLKSFESGYKIVIMWLPEFLGKEGNILLKIIEEPPPSTLFIFITQNEQALLPTIISRCQIINIPMIEPQEIEAYLIEKLQEPSATARQIANRSQGSMLEAINIIRQNTEDWEPMLKQWLNAILKINNVLITKSVDELAALGREKQKHLLKYFLHIIEIAVKVRVGGKILDRFSPSELDFPEKLNLQTSLEQQYAIMELINDSIYHIERNANAKILFQAISIKLKHIIKDKTVFLPN